MNILLWTLQVLAALMYTASGVMKVFMFDKVSADGVLGLLMAFIVYGRLVLQPIG